MDQADLDARIHRYYAHDFAEADRLTTRSAQGRLELERVQEIVRSRIPAGARVVDVGGATGVHAAPLAAAGHEVVLVDPVPEQVATAARVGTFRAVVGDARALDLVDDDFDAALLLGPLYHLARRDDRVLALAEARRVVRPGGWVFAAVIPRLARLAVMMLADDVGILRPTPEQYLALLEHGDPGGWGGFPAGHFHTARELEGELADAGLVDIEVCAIEGPDGLSLEHLSEVDDELHAAALHVVRRVGHLPVARETTNHLMGIGRVSGSS